MSGIVGIILVVGMFIVLGVLLWRGTMRALTLSIFLQGLNAIVRIMMFFPHVTSAAGVADVAYIITSLLSIGISSYLLVRMDRVDIRTLMFR